MEQKKTLPPRGMRSGRVFVWFLFGGAVLALGDIFFLAVPLSLYQDAYCLLRGAHKLKVEIK